MFAKSILIFTSLSLIKSAKILVVVPTPSISHQFVFRSLIQDLIDQQHEVTVITTDPAFPKGESPNNLREIDVHTISYSLWNTMVNTITKCDNVDFLTLMTTAFRLRSKIFMEQLKDKTIKNLLDNKSVKYDLLILEACASPSLIFSHIFDAPVIKMSSFGATPVNLKMIGGPTHPFLYPTHYHQKLYNLSFWDKLSVLYEHIAIDRAFDEQEFEDDKMLQSLFGIETPTTNELRNNFHMLFLNVHPIWFHNYPVSHNVIYTWGIHKSIEKKLPQDLQSYLDSSKYGVIYISFGTNFKTSLFPSERLNIMVQVLSQLPFDILWKWDMEVLPGKSENIKISKWLPQYDVLRHPKIKLFITQGGLQSTEEAINAGVPLIGIPLFADQEYNAEEYKYFKIGLKLNFKTFTKETFENAINTILTNYESYRINIIQLKTLMYDQPKVALENVRYWIGYILRHGGARHLRATSSNMSWTEYYEIELVFIIFSLLIFFVTLSLLATYTCFNFIISNSKSTTSRFKY